MTCICDNTVCPLIVNVFIKGRIYKLSRGMNTIYIPYISHIYTTKNK